MSGPLAGLRVVEAASFIAGPSCGLHLLHLGAEVIRIDPLGGGPDYGRWPQAPGGGSLYWEGLNAGKKSVTLDLSRPEGRELAQRLATAPGDKAGLFVTNFPPTGFLAHDVLAGMRADLISLRIMGWADGTPAVDYTVNAAMGVPLLTGPAELGDRPVNSVLPAWDLLAGVHGALALLAAFHAREATGKGTELRLPLGDLATATLSHLGLVAEALVGAGERARDGNDLHGAFGRDFETADGHRLMLVALTARQWRDLVATLGLEEEIAAVESRLGVSFAHDEGLRYRHRGELNPVVARATGRASLAELTERFEGTGVCWAPYRTLRAAAMATDRFALNRAMLASLAQPSGLTYPAAGAPVSSPKEDRQPPVPAPRLGEHTDEVLADVLGLPEGEICRLRDRGLVG